MPTTATPAKEHQERWNEITADPLLRKLPYKVETNHRGQIVLSPQKNRHTFQQKAIQKTLDDLLSGGEAFQELAIATSGGTKQADVVWASSSRIAEMKETGDPTTLAPEICVEVMSESNDWEEMEEKVHFIAEEEMEGSEIAPGFPRSV